ncbi:MAG: hypothetical protein ACRDLE_12880, partial [Gaiellaceae bacterium]
MSLRARLTLVAAAVVAVVVASASVTTYFVMRHELYSQVDSELSQHAQDPRAVLHGPSPFGGDYVTLVDPSGAIAAGLTQGVPIDASVRRAVNGSRGPFFRDERVAGYHLRQVVVPIRGGGAVVVSRVVNY